MHIILSWHQDVSCGEAVRGEGGRGMQGGVGSTHHGPGGEHSLSVFQTPAQLHSQGCRVGGGQGASRLRGDTGARACGAGLPSWCSEDCGRMLNRAVS